MHKEKQQSTKSSLKQLNQIHKQAVVSWEVSIDNNLSTLADTDWDINNRLNIIFAVPNIEWNVKLRTVTSPFVNQNITQIDEDLLKSLKDMYVRELFSENMTQDVTIDDYYFLIFDEEKFQITAKSNLASMEKIGHIVVNN